MLIAGNRLALKKVVRVSRNGTRQTRIYFPASLVREYKLNGFTRVILDHDEESKKITFIFLNNDFYRGTKTYSLFKEGKKEKMVMGQTCLIRSNALEFLFSRDYKPTLVAKNKLAITYSN
jgi:hypothetical protein